jgi:hypothetical protein
MVLSSRVQEGVPREPLADSRVRVDPTNPSTFRHRGGCDQRDVTYPAMIRATLRARSVRALVGRIQHVRLLLSDFVFRRESVG